MVSALCQCGCGEATAIVAKGGNGYRKGEARRYVHGHHRRGKRRVILEPPNPAGMCLCGCGERAPVANHSCRTRGYLAGHPTRFIAGHHNRVRTTLEPPNPGGFCMCGCGHPAPLARMTNARKGHVAGQPLKFVLGHVGWLKARARIDSSMWIVEDRGYDTPCWIIQRPLDWTGYCRIQVLGKRVLAHRAMYEQEVAPIPARLQLDHLCTQKDCIRPTHLEPVTASVNQLRAIARRSTLEGRRGQ